jgi:hypothetical protein
MCLVVAISLKPSRLKSNNLVQNYFLRENTFALAALFPKEKGGPGGAALAERDSVAVSPAERRTSSPKARRQRRQSA